MSYAGKTTTNNVAEYLGLLTGLKACANNRWIPLNVVGDSAMIIHQQLRRSPPKAAHLKAIYMRSRRIADTLVVRSWRHHLREHNKTADALVNRAMNLRRSAQIDPTLVKTKGTRWATAIKHAASDVAYYRDTGDLFGSRGRNRVSMEGTLGVGTTTTREQPTADLEAGVGTDIGRR
ncbi:hypothetical protein PHMEG_0008732 [Phytophthora megakarya]|uniref:RNase H type-1 domain-containing protein n=1 Tax=Phytophthora megakarya TaxID=4795 RepID=A0A225WJB0_9STRA|nr:hypothetical protein PHMEG_0008732 [Phytophthora megakarya]